MLGDRYMPKDDRNKYLSDSVRLRSLSRAIRAKIPEHDAEDIIQSTIADALAASAPPLDTDAFDRWLLGIAGHKIADYYRRSRNHAHVDFDSLASDSIAETVPESARDLLRWVDRELPPQPETTRTLEWMMREASGDKLEAIAEEHSLPAPAVRQRVSRLRRFLRERWALQAAAALGLCAVVTGLFAWQRTHRRTVRAAPEIVRLTPSPAEEARKLRAQGLEACAKGQWQPCLADLDRAKALDPGGDPQGPVQEARAGAALALHPPAQAPDSVPSSAPASVPASQPSSGPTTRLRPRPTPAKSTGPKQFPQQSQSKSSNLFLNQGK